MVLTVYESELAAADAAAPAPANCGREVCDSSVLLPEAVHAKHYTHIPAVVDVARCDELAAEVSAAGEESGRHVFTHPVFTYHPEPPTSRIDEENRACDAGLAHFPSPVRRLLVGRFLCGALDPRVLIGWGPLQVRTAGLGTQPRRATVVVRPGRRRGDGGRHRTLELPRAGHHELGPVDVRVHLGPALARRAA